MDFENLNLKYKIVQLNKNWDYFLKNKQEAGILRTMSSYILDNIKMDNSFFGDDLVVPNMDFEMMIDIARDFFNNINKSLSDKVEFAIANTHFIEESGRAVTNDGGIYLYYKKASLNSLISYVHEISHVVANLSRNSDGKIIILKKCDKARQFTEIESVLTEDLFLRYLLMNDKYDIKSLNDEYFKKVRYERLKYNLRRVERVDFELKFQHFMESRGYKDLNKGIVEEFAILNNMNLYECYKRINEMFGCYCSENHFQDFLSGKEMFLEFDERSGNQLSNTCRFIYANCFSEKFNSMDISFDDRRKIYFEYLEKAKYMGLKDICEMFSIDDNLMSIADSFIMNYMNFFDENKKYSVKSYI